MEITVNDGSHTTIWEIDENVPHHWPNDWSSGGGIPISDNINNLISIKFHAYVDEKTNGGTTASYSCDLNNRDNKKMDAEIKYNPKLGMWSGDDGWSSNDKDGFGFLTGYGDASHDNELILDVEFHFDIKILSGRSDDDGVPALTEVLYYGTSPTSSDTDQDGIDDEFEIEYNVNQMIIEGIKYPGLHPLSDYTKLSTIDVFYENNFDFNKDGKADWDVNCDGVIDAKDLGPFDYNKDGDTDDRVSYYYESILGDLNGNGKCDAFLADVDNDGLSWYEEYIVHTQFKGIPINHQDIYVEVDWMEGHSFKKLAQIDVILQFARHKISLHIDTGWMGGGEEVTPHKDVTESDATSGDYNDMYDYKDKYFDYTHRWGIFHYALFAHNTGAGTWGLGSLGVSEGGGGGNPPNTGDDILIGEGNWKKYIPESVQGDDDYIQAIIFMHELGHNLGLYYGGGIKYEGSTDGWNPLGPVSCMNYYYIYSLLDYSSDEWSSGIYLDIDTWNT
jgi:hypothetical protein